MKIHRPTSNLTISVLLAVTTTLLVAWLADPTLLRGHWLARLAVVILSLGASLAILRSKLRLEALNQSTLRRAVELLCRSESHELISSEEVNSKVDARNPWYQLFTMIQGTFDRLGRQVQDAEHLRAAAEARARRMNAELELLREILNGLPEPLLAVDRYGELIVSNVSAQRVLGIRTESGSRGSLGEYVKIKPLVELMDETRKRRAPSQRSTEFSLSDASGQTRWYRVLCRPLSTAAKSSVISTEELDRHSGHSVVAVFTDITPSKSAQTRHAEFVSAVSHEMKTPLTGIKAYVEMLADGDAEDVETREGFLEVINGQTDRLQRLIDNLLNLARIEAGVVEVRKAICSLNEVLEEAARIIRPAADQKSIDLRIELSPMYLGVLMDRDMLLQAVINLVSNAVKYTPNGGIVTLHSRSQDQDVEFEVEDTGVGLSEQDSQRVFEKFYRVKKDQSMAPGTGLGLALAKHIVENVHGGRLAVSSVLGQGSTFRATLPAAGRSNNESGKNDEEICIAGGR